MQLFTSVIIQKSNAAGWQDGRKIIGSANGFTGDDIMEKENYLRKTVSTSVQFRRSSSSD